MMAETSGLTSTIEFYSSVGLSFFPLPYGQKSDPKYKWGTFQQRRPSDAEVRHWFNNGTKHNIAVVCGKVSGNLVVLDCDSEQQFYELAATICAKLNMEDILDFTRVSKTGKGYHIWLFSKEPVQSAKFPKLDIKAEGGYIVAPPSLHPNGHNYEFVNPSTPIKHIESLLDIGIDLKQGRYKGVTENVTEGQPILEGDRNQALTSLAGTMRRRGMPQEAIEAALLVVNNNQCHPPLPDIDIRAIAKSVSKYPPLNNPPLSPPPTRGGEGTYSPVSASLDTERDKIVTKSVTDGSLLDPLPSYDLGLQRYKGVTENVTENMSKRLQDWIKETGGAWFSYEEIDKEFGIKDANDKLNRRVIMKRLKDAGAIEAHPKDNKRYRYVKTAVRLIDFKAAIGSHSLTIKYPFQIEQYFKTYPGNIIVVAGAPDAGKTAFLLNFIRLNQLDYSIFYQSSEMGQDELANRLKNFEGISLDEWNFTAEERSSDFADIIRPDCVNIIDYMELSGEFYMVAEYLKQIHDKLASGIAIVALQKDPKSDQGRGGTFGLEKPRLYLNLDAGKITIRKAKNWTQPDVNPNRLERQFKIVAGCRFIEMTEWHKPDDF